MRDKQGRPNPPGLTCPQRRKEVTLQARGRDAPAIEWPFNGHPYQDIARGNAYDGFAFLVKGTEGLPIGTVVLINKGSPAAIQGVELGMILVAVNKACPLAGGYEYAQQVGVRRGEYIHLCSETGH